MSNSIHGSASADASASAWAGAATSAAEAYADEQVAAAARRRDEAEAAALARGSDGVDPPPTSGESGAWPGDGDRPAPSGGSSSGSGGHQPVPLDLREAAALRAAGVRLPPPPPPTPEGIQVGGAVFVTVPAPPPPPVAPDNILPIPDVVGEVKTDAPTEPPPAPPEPPATPVATKAAEETKSAEKPKSIEEIFGKEVNDILQKSPTLQKLWKEAQARGWQIERTYEGRSEANPNKNPPTISINLADVRAGEGFEHRVAALLAHEIGHAVTPFPKVDEAHTRDEFIRQNVENSLAHEGAAAFENARARYEIRANGGPDITIRGDRDIAYIEIYGRYLAGAITESDAKAEMTGHFAEEWADRDDAGNPLTYVEKLSNYYADQWDKAQHSNEKAGD